MPDIETKVCRTDIEFKEVNDRPGIAAEISGFATTYELPENYDSYGDVVAPGAVDVAALKDLPMLNAHDEPIGVWVAFEDNRKDARGVPGLWVKGEIADTQLGIDVAKLIKIKAMKGLSIGFRTKKYSEFLDTMVAPYGFPVRSLDKIDLLEVSPCAIPANPHAQVDSVRDARKADYELRQRAEAAKQKEEEATRAIEDKLDAALKALTPEDKQQADDSQSAEFDKLLQQLNAIKV